MADEQLIKPRELPAATTVFADDAIMTDNGSIVGKATPVQIVNAGAPVPTEAEAIAGTDNSKRMTPLTTKQVLDNVTAPSVLRAQAWAESDSPPNPGIPSSMSAKSWAAEAERLGAEQADRAEDAADRADLRNPFVIRGVDGFSTIPPTSYLAGSVDLVSWWPDKDQGSGRYVFDAARPKSQHNGGTIISPTVPFNPANYAAFLAGTGETNPSGSGVWVRQTDGFHPVTAFGALPDSGFNSLPALRKSVSVLNYISLSGYFHGAGGDLVINRSFFHTAFSQGSITLDAGRVHFDPFSMSAGNFLINPEWVGINVTRTGAAGEAILIDGDYPTTKGVSNIKLADFEINSTGKGLIARRPILGRMERVSTGNCADLSWEILEANVWHMLDCRPFNSKGVVMDGCVSWSIKGGSAEKLRESIKLIATNRVNEVFEISGVWFEDNDETDIQMLDGQHTTGRILTNRFRNDTGLDNAVLWNSARDVVAEGNRYTGYPYPHSVPSVSSTIMSSVSKEIYGGAITWCDNPTGRLSRLDEERAVVSVTVGSVSSGGTASFTVSGSPFGSGTGIPSSANDAVDVQMIPQQYAGIEVSGLITSAGAITVVVHNRTAAAIDLGTRKFNLTLYRN